MDFSSKEYLADSEKRINRLRKIINGRPVAILAAGPSIKQLEDRIEELRHGDICYFGFNRFLQERFILQKINKRLPVFMQSTGPFLREYFDEIISFLSRDDENIFISTSCQNTYGFLGKNFDMANFLNTYDEKLLFFSIGYDKTVPNENQPLHFPWGNSLMLLTQLALIGRASKIVLFGADGGCREGSTQTHYREKEYYPMQDRDMKTLLAWDANRGFNPIMPIAVRNVYNTYKISPIDILNCSQGSLYTSFPTISYDEAFKYLLTNKKFDRKSDLRVPKISVISTYANNEKYLKETIESISSQSYSNHEHLIIYEDADNKMQEIMRQFSYIKWIPKTTLSNLQEFEKSILSAKGDYIFCCHTGDGYSSQDWFNTCAEILENNPDISLVWGLSRQIAGDNKSCQASCGDASTALLGVNFPPQGKKYLYYWFKKKILFPNVNFCVRKNVLLECFPFSDPEINDESQAWITFNYRFNTSGYLPYFVPAVVNYNRIEKLDSEAINKYHKDIKNYEKKLFRKELIHRYRMGSGKVLLGNFNRYVFMFFDMDRYLLYTVRQIKRYLRCKSPKVCLVVIDKILFFWRTYKLNIFKMIIVALWRRLIRTIRPDYRMG